MPRKAPELNALAVKRLVEPGLHAVGGVDGLQLRVKPSRALRNAPTEDDDAPPVVRSWVLRVKIGDRRPDIGLGGYPDVTLEQARTEARRIKQLIRDGRDPLLERHSQAAALKAAQAKDQTFDQVAKLCHEAKRPGWKNPKHGDQWINTLTNYASPKLGTLPIGLIDTPQVLEVLRPIWTVKTETATRVRQRIEAVIDYAIAAQMRPGPNPASWNALKALLPKAQKVKRVKHQPALPWADAGRFMAHLRTVEGVDARALELLMLTAARSHMVREATWAEFDLDAKLWTLSAARMKGEKPLRIPLSDPAVKLLKALPRHEGNAYLFTGRRSGKPISSSAMDLVMKAMHRAALEREEPGYLDRIQQRVAVPHGLRSTFKDWARNAATRYLDEVSELALAHINSDETRSAYARDELLPLRTNMMRDWAKHCGTVPRKPTGGNVVAIRRKA